MELNFLSIAEINHKAKATIHLSGRLGFNSEATDLMRLHEVQYFRVAIDGDASTYKHIYLLPSDIEDVNNIKVAKAGDYYSIALANVFNRLGIDYTNYKVIFDVLVEEYEGHPIYKLKRRAKEIKRSVASSKEEGEE